MIDRFVRTIATVAVVLAAGKGMAQTGNTSDTDAPPVPGNLEVPDGYSVFLKARATGTQNYMCLPVRSGVAWKLIGPQATLFLTTGGNFSQQVATHFLSANPSEGGLPRPTWQHSFDSSRVWARALASSTDPNYVEPGAIPWLLLAVVGAENGPEGGAFFTQTAFVQRVHTAGGVAPSTGCVHSADTGTLVLVPYGADYFFYKASSR